MKTRLTTLLCVVGALLAGCETAPKVENGVATSDITVNFPNSDKYTECRESMNGPTSEYYLGILVSNLVNVLGPECVVIGGGIAARMGEDFVAPIRQTAYKYFLRADDVDRVKVVPGKLGDNAGALGAVILARQRLT